VVDWQIIPAAAITHVIYDLDGTLEVIDEVIAWRINTVLVRGEPCSEVTAITVDGDAGENVVGVQHADTSVTIFAKAYTSLAEAQEDYNKV
jgi:hypothetical protein